MIDATTYMRAVAAAATLAAAVGVGAQQPARDTPAQQQQGVSEQPSAAIGGRVLAADTGRPVKGARVSVSGAELPGGRAVLTDDSGTFLFTDLAAGRYSVSVSKSGFVSLAYGQRRPLQPGTPLQLADGQELTGLVMQLPRGSVIAGHVYDETGEPLPGVLVRVLRYQYQQGQRRLTTAGTAQTNDLGEFRVWGLNPGEYYVDAQSRINLPFGNLPARGRGGQGAIAGLVGALAGGNVATLFRPEDETQRAYAPTFFPGVTAIAEAQPIALGLSQTNATVDFSLQLVPVARVSGRVLNPDGSPTSRGNVSLTGEVQVAGRGNQLGMNYGSRLDGNGGFSIANVPPGRYTLRARGNDAEWPQYAMQPVTVGGTDVDDLTITVNEGAVVTGTIGFAPSAADPPSLGQARISSVATAPGLTNSQARIEPDLTFRIVAIPAGAHLFRPTGQWRGWSLRSVVLDGRDITDTPIEIGPGQQLSRMIVTLTDAVSEINGTITNDRGLPVPDYTVLAFSTDPSHWHPQTRHIATARPDQTGQFRIRNLPAGAYYLATVDPGEQGEWYEPSYLDAQRVVAAQVTLGEGETRTQDFRVRGTQ